MNKKKLTSLALASILATSVAVSGVFAEGTTDPETKSLGEYSTLITGKVAVPFILQSENDRVTGKDLKAAYPNKNILVYDDTLLKTGAVIYIDGEPRTIVIYGDTNCDGKINIMDAVTSLNHVKGKSTLKDAAFAAADLNNNGSIDILEAVGVLNVVKGKNGYSAITTAPEAEKALTKPTTTLGVNATTKHQILTWALDKDAASYKVNIYKYDENGVKSTTAIKTVDTSAKNECDLTEAVKELKYGKYSVTVTSIAAPNSLKLNSDESTAIDIYSVKEPSLTLSLANSNTVTASLSSLSDILASDASKITYELYYGKKVGTENINYTKYTGNFTTVDSVTKANIALDYNTTYNMYVLVKFNGTEIARTAIKEIATEKTHLDLTTAKTVVTWDGSAKLNAGEIAYKDNSLVIGTSTANEVYTANDADNYASISTVVQALNAKDTIQEDANGQISVVKTNATEANYGEALANVNLTLNVDTTEGTTDTANTAVKISGKLKSITMGTRANADLSLATVSDKVYLKANDTVYVKKAAAATAETAAIPGTVVVVPVGKVTINDIELNSTATTNVTATATGLDIVGTTNNITVIVCGDATINFTGTQSGDVSLTESAADVAITLLSENSLSKVIVNAGNVNLSGVSCTEVNINQHGSIIFNSEKAIAHNGMNLTIAPSTTDAVLTAVYSDEDDGLIVKGGENNYTISFYTTEDETTSASFETSKDFTLKDDAGTVTVTASSATYSVDSNGNTTLAVSGDVKLLQASTASVE